MMILLTKRFYLLPRKFYKKRISETDFYSFLSNDTLNYLDDNNIKFISQLTELVFSSNNRRLFIHVYNFDSSILNELTSLYLYTIGR